VRPQCLARASVPSPRQPLHRAASG
jgi:hypothetical protein